MCVRLFCAATREITRALGQLRREKGRPRLVSNASPSVKVNDGTHTVGQNMEAGTYRTMPNAKDC